MYLRKPGWKNLRMGITSWDKVDGMEVLKVIEEYGRKCYKTEGKMTEDSAIPFISKRLDQGHIALFDHLHITAEYVTDRGVSHEWLRHKLTEILGSGIFEPADDFTPMAVCQESTRYCNYMKSGGVVFIIPPWVSISEGEYTSMSPIGRLFKNRAERIWYQNCLSSEYTYLELLKEGWTPQQARGDLLIKTKTEFIVTCSITEWLHIFSQRVVDAAHSQMREVMRPQLANIQAKIPVIFDRIKL